MIVKVNYLIAVSILVAIIINSCSADKSTDPNNDSRVTNDYLVDHGASEETVALFDNIKSLSQNNLLFGHQETSAYRVGWRVNSGDKI